MLRGVSRFAQNGAPQSRRQTEQWQMLDDTIASASINDIRVLPQKHSPGVGGLSRAIVVVSRQSAAKERGMQRTDGMPLVKCSVSSVDEFSVAKIVRTTRKATRKARGALDRLAACKTLAHTASRETPRRAERIKYAD